MRRYITPELYKFLDVGHLCDTFAVNSLEDIAPLKEASGMYNIRLPHIIQYTFANSLNDAGTLVPGYEHIGHCFSSIWEKNYFKWAVVIVFFCKYFDMADFC